MTAAHHDRLALSRARRNTERHRPVRARLEALAARGFARVDPMSEGGRNRTLFAATSLALCFAILALRLVDLGAIGGVGAPRLVHEAAGGLAVGRADIVDRNGVVLATNLKTASLYANPRKVIDKDEAVRKLAAVLPDIAPDTVRDRLGSGRAFVWLKRNLTPRQHWLVNSLGLPGFGFRTEDRRLYPHGPLAAHVLGFVDVDNKGIAGVERRFDETLSEPAPMGDDPMRGALALSLDVRVQHAVRDELMRGLERYRAKAAGAIVLDIHTGETLALVSLPDFDPNAPGGALPAARFNRASLGVYELGSVFKTFTIALALETGTATLGDGYDATKPIRVARYTIRDDHPKARWLSVPEIFVYSSNIGAAKMALDIGAERQRAFLSRLGLLDPSAIELPEVGQTLAPEPWREINTMTIAFGHGIAVSPLQAAAAVGSLVNGGFALRPTILKREAGQVAERGPRVVSAETSRIMRRLMRAAVQSGTGAQAEAAGYLVGGKTGTAEKSGPDGYRRGSLLSSFVGVFPGDSPRYLVFVMFDEPEGTAETHGFATAGWNAAPITSAIIGRIAPILGVEPHRDAPEAPDWSPEPRATQVAARGWEVR